MENLYEQFVAWVTKWNLNDKVDDFLAARVGLTFYYLITAVIILGGSSIITYNAILSNFAQSILERGFDLDITKAIILDAQKILMNRFLTIDSIIILFTVVTAFLLTSKTLKPIKLNMQKQKRFITDASHELRTPIAVIISGIEVALNNKKLDLPLAKKTLESSLEEMREFSKLSNNLLDISRYETPSQMDYESISINELIKSIVEKNKNLAGEKKIQIETKIEYPATINGNKIELSRVFYNILDNAIKHTPSGGTILISDKIISNKYITTVSDSGIGIPENIIGKIFDPFFRGESSRNSSGAGLGLTLVKKIIENHNGTITVKSQINKGTNVIISLPLAS